MKAWILVLYNYGPPGKPDEVGRYTLDKVNRICYTESSVTVYLWNKHSPFPIQCDYILVKAEGDK